MGFFVFVAYCLATSGNYEKRFVGERPAQDGVRNPKKSDGVLRERCAVKYAWIDGQRKAYPLPAMCATLDVSLSGYQAWKRGGTPNRKRVHGTRYETREEAIADAFDYIEPFYNRRRKHSTLGYASPQQFFNDWIRCQHEHELAA